MICFQFPADIVEQGFKKDNDIESMKAIKINPTFCYFCDFCFVLFFFS